MLNRVIFGCGHLVSGPGQCRANCLIDQCVEAGLRCFDTAPLYGLGGADRALALALASHDGEIRIHTKVGLARPKFGAVKTWIKAATRALPRPELVNTHSLPLPALAPPPAETDPALPRGNFDRQSIERSFAESQRLLGRQCVDALFLHEAYGDNITEGALEALRRLKRAGAATEVGLANGCAHSATLERLAPPDFLVQAGAPPEAFTDGGSEFGERHILHTVIKSFAWRRANDSAFAQAVSACEVRFRSLLEPDSQIALAYVLLAAVAPRSRLIYATSEPERLRYFLAAMGAVTRAGAHRDVVEAFQVSYAAAKSRLTSS